MACIKSHILTSLQESVYGGAVASFFVHLRMPKDSPSYLLGQLWVAQPSLIRTTHDCACPH